MANFVVLIICKSSKQTLILGILSTIVVAYSCSECHMELSHCMHYIGRSLQRPETGNSKSFQQTRGSQTSAIGANFNFPIAMIGNSWSINLQKMAIAKWSCSQKLRFTVSELLCRNTLFEIGFQLQLSKESILTVPHNIFFTNGELLTESATVCQKANGDFILPGASTYPNHTTHKVQKSSTAIYFYKNFK